MERLNNETGLVPEGLFQKERQEFMEAAEEVFGARGYGELNWSTETRLNRRATSWAGSEYVELSQRKTPEYFLYVVLDGRDVVSTHFKLELANGPSGWERVEATRVKLDTGGRLLDASNFNGQKRSGVARYEEVQLVLASATSFLKDVLVSSEWKAKPVGPVYDSSVGFAFVNG